MNSTFKVIFNRARGALMVVNEATSSVQAKGTKTVIAAAAAAMIAGAAGSAGAAALATEAVTITGKTSEMTVTGAAFDRQIVSGSASVKNTDADAVAWADKETEAESHQLTADTAVTLADGAAFTVREFENTARLGGRMTVSNGGAISIIAGSGKDAAHTVVYADKGTSFAAADTTAAYDQLNISLKTYNGTSESDDGAAALAFDSVTGGAAKAREVILTNGVLKVTSASADNAVQPGQALLSNAGALTFGTAARYFAGSTTEIETAARAYDIETSVNTATTISAAAITYNAGTITNAGTLTFDAGAKVTVGKDVDFMNSGVLTFDGAAGVDFRADYEAGEKGKLLLISAADVLVNGTVTAGKAVVGADVPANKYQVVISGAAGNTIGEDGVLAVSDLSITSSLTVYGAVAAEKTVLEETVRISGTASDSASAELGDVTIRNAAAGIVLDNKWSTVSMGAVTVDGRTLAVENGNSGTAVGIASADVRTAGGKLHVKSGAVELGSLSSDAAGAVELGVASTSNAVLTLTGAESVNKGTVTFNAKATTVPASDNTLVIAHGALLSNEGTIGTADVPTTGTVTVAGTLTNKRGVSGENAGTIGVRELTVAAGGVVDVTMDAKYAVAATTIEEGGVFKTALNKKIVSSTADDTLSLTKTFTLAGDFADGSGAAIRDFNLDASGVMNVVADKEFGRVTVNGTGASFVVGKKAAVAVGTFDAKVGAVTAADPAAGAVMIADGSSLTVGALKTSSTAGVNVAEGTLTASLAAMGRKLHTTAGSAPVTTVKTLAAEEVSGSGAVFRNSILLGQDSVLAVEGLTAQDSMTVANVKAAFEAGGSDEANVVAAGSKGLVDLGALTISDLIAEGKDYVSAAAAANLAGITNDRLKGAAVDGLTTLGTSAIYGRLIDTEGALTATGGVFGISGGTLTLTASDAELATWIKTTGTTKSLELTAFAVADGAKIVTTGDRAVIGAVNAAGTAAGALSVASGDLTARGTVKVGELDVAGTLTVAENTASAADAEAFSLEAVTAVIAGRVIAEYGTVTLGSGSRISGEGTKVKNLAAAGGLLVIGSAAVTNELTAGSVADAVLVGNDKNAGSLSVGKLAAGQIFADPAWDQEGHSVVAVASLDTAAGILAGRNSVVSLGTTDVSAGDKVLAASGFRLGETKVSDRQYSENTFTVNSAVYAEGRQIAGNVGANAVSTFTGVASNVNIAQNSMLAVDAEKIDRTGETSVFLKQVTLAPGSVLAVANLKNSDRIKLSAVATVLEEDKVYAAVDGSIVRSLELGDDGILTVRMEDRADLARTCGLDDVAGLGLVYAMYEQDKNLGASESVKFNNWLYTANAFNTYINADEERDVNTKLIKEIAGESAALGATTGVQTVTLDAVNMMADTAAARTSILSRKTEGARVWADMNGGSFEAKKLFGGAGYSADIWAGSIGVDYTAACGGTIGAALTIGTADTDSRNTGVRSSADSDLVGFTVYANKTFNDVLNVAADLGYLKASNDVTANGYEHSWKFAQDTDAFTFGIRGEILAKAGSANIVPHAGLRWTRISTDGFEAGYTTDVASMNVFQLPLGVTVSGEFEAAGWTIAPKVDFSVVPAFGDKDAELRLGIAGVSASEDLTVRTVDSSPVQAALGLSAEKGGWAFDLGCKLGAGSGSRMNSMFNAGVRYAF